MMRLLSTFLLASLSTGVSALSAPSPIYETIRASQVLDPSTGQPSSPFDSDPTTISSSKGETSKSLVVILPQLGELIRPNIANI